MTDRAPLASRPLEIIALAFVLAMAALRALTAASAGLSADEAYYWQWIHPLQLSYLDHPAMVAYWIWAGVQTAGETAFGVRLPAVLGGLLVSALVWDTARQAFESRRAAAWAVIWLNGSVLFSSAGVIITPDTPLLVFWSCALWALVRLIKTGQARYMLLTGLALGLGAISKYTIALLLPGAVLTFLLFPGLRPWWRRPITLGGVALALVCTLPLWLWNWQHDFASFRKQLNHAFVPQEAVHPLPNLGAFLGGQIGLVTPLIFGFCLWAMGWVLWRGWRDKRAEWFLLGAVSLPILLFFGQHSLGGLVQAHWGGPAYLGAVIAAAGAEPSLRSTWSRRLFIAAPILGAVLTLVVLFQAGTALLPLPIKADPLKRLGGWAHLAEVVAEERTAHPGSFLFTEKHEPTGPVSFYLPDHPPVFLQGRIRPSYYSAEDVAALKGHDGLFITQSKSDAAKDLTGYFSKMTLLRQVGLPWGKHSADRYDLYLAEGYKGGLFTQGEGWDGTRDRP